MITHTKRNAFTLVEMMVAIAVVGILATAGAISYSNSERAARDGRRKSDVQTYAQAVGSYVTAKGNAAIRNATGCDNLPGASPQDPSAAVTGTGCTGANGRGYGLVNASSGTSPATPFGDGGRTYSGSIAGALKSQGYLGTAAADPSGAGSSNASAGKPDYVLIRGCSDGRENVSYGGTSYAVWAHLEAPADPVSPVLGSVTAKASAANKTLSSDYAYDFAAGPYSAQASDTDHALNFAAGSTLGSTSYVGSCATDEKG